MNKELNEDARTKQELLFECSSLESRLSDEIIKNENLITMTVNQKTNAIDLYNFIQRYLPFDTVIELYKLIQYKLINLDDEPYNYCNLAKKVESDE